MGERNLQDCLIYLDDIVIFSSTFEEHIERLEAVFSRLHSQNLKLKASKCEFLKSSITYLGHVVSEAGIHTALILKRQKQSELGQCQSQ